MLQEKRDEQSDLDAYVKKENEFLAECQSLDLNKARESVIDLLTFYIKQEPTFYNLTYWEKRV